MALIVADRIRESLVVNGTGPLTLGGPVLGFATFASVCAVGDTVYYCIVDAGKGDYEIGLGTFGAGNTLARTTVYSSSNKGAVTNFVGNRCDVFHSFPATPLRNVLTATSSPSAKASSYMVACRQRSVPDTNTTDTTSNSLNSRMTCFAPARAGLTDIVLAFPGWGVNNPEADLPQGYSVTASIEYPAGVFTPVYGADGSRTLTVAAGRTLPRFQPACISIPAGAQFWVKTYATWTVGTFWLSRHTAAWIVGDWTVRGTGLTDETLVAGARTTTSADGFAPFVYARLTSPTAVLGLIGDSITQTAVEWGEPSTGSSFLERAMRGQIPIMNLARSSDQASFYLSRHEGRDIALRDACTHVFIGYGRNDIVSSDVSAPKSNVAKIYDLWLKRGVKVYGNTITPYTRSSDNWATRANQYFDAPILDREPGRIAYNNWLRASWQSLGLSGLWDWAWAVDPNDTGFRSADGVFGNNAAGTSVLAGGSISSATMGSFNALGNAGGSGYPASTSVPCVVRTYPGTGGSGAVVTGNVNGSGLVTSYTVSNGGAGYTYPPMVAPMGAWTNDGIHPNHRGYNEIITFCGIAPELFA
ncbi:SGNH/GDSL hydrolase family protein [Limobrevibacterium gyesilva]|uniref:SGNH/GDSL hydrolase family protein n=1 Tax=Limobrevibacterium gyesilva TaxID=2991712 RepID=A0AA41YPH9_9PROT|nr:SGNH/GDSL hydrolase family protein [Limobrevibacterium gyesilva]MCW3476336.1 SGNH/GDSL hydrolase family protein [Limobrevibacterium gyesilva]